MVFFLHLLCRIPFTILRITRSTAQNPYHRVWFFVLLIQSATWFYRICSVLGIKYWNQYHTRSTQNPYYSGDFRFTGGLFCFFLIRNFAWHDSLYENWDDHLIIHLVLNFFPPLFRMHLMLISCDRFQTWKFNVRTNAPGIPQYITIRKTVFWINQYWSIIILVSCLFILIQRVHI